MPTYEFECKKCGMITEKVFKMSKYPQTIKCECGGRARKIISTGVIRTDNDVTWLPSASKVLVRPHEKPLKTRTEYKKYLKDNGLQPIE